MEITLQNREQSLQQSMNSCIKLFNETSDSKRCHAIPICAGAPRTGKTRFMVEFARALTSEEYIANFPEAMQDACRRPVIALLSWMNGANRETTEEQVLKQHVDVGSSICWRVVRALLCEVDLQSFFILVVKHFGHRPLYFPTVVELVQKLLDEPSSSSMSSSTSIVAAAAANQSA